MKRFLKRIATAGVLNSLVLSLVALSANSACCWVYHQPEFPDAASKFKKH